MRDVLTLQTIILSDMISSVILFVHLSLAVEPSNLSFFDLVKLDSINLFICLAL